MNPESKLYEISYTLRAEGDEDAVSKIDKIKKYIETKNGMNLEESRPMKRRLAYPIERYFEAYFGNIRFYLRAEDVKELNELIKKDANFLRHLITVPEKHTDKPASARRIRKAPEQTESDIKEIDKKLEEILG